MTDMSTLPSTITRGDLPAGNGFLYSTPWGPISATAKYGTGWTLTQWTPATGLDWLGQFASLDAVEAHLAANYAR